MKITKEGLITEWKKGIGSVRRKKKMWNDEET